jgi:hypothetical protein
LFSRGDLLLAGAVYVGDDDGGLALREAAADEGKAFPVGREGDRAAGVRQHFLVIILRAYDSPTYPARQALRAKWITPEIKTPVRFPIARAKLDDCDLSIRRHGR